MLRSTLLRCTPRSAFQRVSPKKRQWKTFDTLSSIKEKEEKVKDRRVDCIVLGVFAVPFGVIVYFYAKEEYPHWTDILCGFAYGVIGGTLLYSLTTPYPYVAAGFYLSAAGLGKLLRKNKKEDL